MALIDYKVQSGEIIKNRLRSDSAPDRLVGSPDENKQVFDRFAPLFANKVMKTTIYSKLILVRFIQKRLTQKVHLTPMKKLMN